MKTKTILVALCLITGYLTSAPATHAAGYQINDTTVLFFTPFSISASYGSFGIPVVADHTASYFDRVDVIGYELADTSGPLTNIATVSDIVLSNAPLVGTRYEMATGTEAMFTIVSIVTFTEPIDTDITSTITKLPFWVDGRRTTLHQNQLDDIAPSLLKQ